MKYNNSYITQEDVKNYLNWLKSDDGKESIKRTAEHSKQRKKQHIELKKHTRNLTHKVIWK